MAPLSNSRYTLGNDGGMHVYCLSKGLPAYQLHDLLSKPFCEAFINVLNYDGEVTMSPKTLGEFLNIKYYDGGIEVVEKALMEMMEAT